MNTQNPYKSVGRERLQRARRVVFYAPETADGGVAGLGRWAGERAKTGGGAKTAGDVIC